MKRTHVFLAVALASAASAATVASAQSSLPAAAHSSRAATVQLRHTSLGSILVSSSGRTLYEFTRDHGNKNSCAAISGCSAVWPSLKASGRPTAGSGVKASLLSTTSGHQVTYAGHPLYTYSGDSGPGKTSYVGVKAFGGTWYAINASGGTVK
jgi:predicted lipoprotein with Yx(FWY)xxD motif